MSILLDLLTLRAVVGFRYAQKAGVFKEVCEVEQLM